MQSCPPAYTIVWGDCIDLPHVNPKKYLCVCSVCESALPTVICNDCGGTAYCTACDFTYHNTIYTKHHENPYCFALQSVDKMTLVK